CSRLLQKILPGELGASRRGLSQDVSQERRRSAVGDDLPHVTVLEPGGKLAEGANHLVVRARVERGQPAGEVERDARAEPDRAREIAIEDQEVEDALRVYARGIDLPVLLEGAGAPEQGEQGDVLFLRAPTRVGVRADASSDGPAHTVGAFDVLAELQEEPAFTAPHGRVRDT